MIERKQIFIGGRWVDSTSREVLTVVNPYTEEPIAHVPRGSAEDVDRAVQAAVSAFESWSRSPVAQRIELFDTLARLTEARSDELTRTVVSELGYPAAWVAK